MNDIEKRIAAALDAAEPEELDALLDGVENDAVAEILNDVTGFDMNYTE